jgi:hypothetical protein
MRKIYLIGLLALLVGAFSALSASSAFALTFTLAEWLNNGNAITANESVDTEGELLFENVLNGGAILCEGLFEGTVGANGADSITAVVNLAGATIASLDAAGSTGGIVCSGVKICETGSEIWPVGLPFKTELNLDTEDGKFYDLILNAEYAILCLFLGGSIEELCVAAANTFGEVINGTTDVEALKSAEPNGTCNGNTLDGSITVDTSLTSLLAGTLTVSN